MYENDVWQNKFTGLHTDENGSIYYIVSGVAKLDAGLVRIVLENQEVNYYYFCNGSTMNGCHKNGTAVKNGVHWVADNNNLLPQADYTFDANGVIVHEDTSWNGIHADANGVDYYFIDGVKAYVGLIKIGEHYYYVRTGGQVVKNATYWISKTNGIVPEGKYVIDENGIVDFGGVIPNDGTEQPPVTPPTEPEIPPQVKNGIVDENGTLYYYVNGVRTYAGLIEIDGYYDYVKSNCEAVKDGVYYITKTNGIMKEGRYPFDAQGRMIIE